MTKKSSLNLDIPNWIALTLLLAIFTLALTSMRIKSATFDEDAYVGKGAAAWFRGEFGLRTAHPALAPILATAPLLTEPGFGEKVGALSKCESGSARSCGREMLFHRSNTHRVLFLVRLPIVMLLVALGALVYRWSRELYGGWGGLLALIVYALEPNLLAHGRLLTLDLAATFFAFLVVYTAWRFWQRPGWTRLLAWGVALGLAGATRYTLGFLVPVLIVVAILRARSGHLKLWQALGALMLAGCVAALTVWAVYGFSFGVVPDWSTRLPAPAYFYDLNELLAYRDKPQDAFLLGQNYTGGRWYYFIVTLVIKTPLPVLILLGSALVLLVQHRDVRSGEPFILTTVGFYYALSLFSPLNIGHRHLLLILPLLSVFIGRLGPWLAAGKRTRRYVAGGLIAWLAFGTLRIHPHYLAYFNELVGPRDGYRVLVDSNLDWGQDLPALERYVQEHDVSSLYLSWFGESRPEQYDIPHRYIPSKPDELSDLFTRVYHPDYPPPGTYAISATNLQGVLFDDEDLFGYFLHREPVAQPGYSIQVYEIERMLDAEASPVAVTLGSTQIDQVPPLAFEEYWHTNDLRLRWFDAEDSCTLPASEESWYVLPADAANASSLCLSLSMVQDGLERLTTLSTRNDGDELQLYHRRNLDQSTREVRLRSLGERSSLIISNEIDFAPGDTPNQRREVNPPLHFGERLDFVGYRTSSETLHPGTEWTLVSFWRVAADGGMPLKAFVQLLDDAGNPRAKYDGFDVPVIGWREGDLLMQRHSLSIPDDLQPGRYWVQFGLYNAWAKDRLPVLLDNEKVGSRLLLPPLEVR
jgi:hypothetical protein